MGYFPFFVDIEGKRGLIVGGGEVARRKVSKLLPFGPRLTVIAPVIAEELLESKEVTCVQRFFCKEDIQGQMFVIAASDEADVNREVGKLCREKNIPVNVADEKEACSFLFPALVKEGKLTVGISTAGVSPAMAGRLRSSVEAALPCDIGEELERLADLREQVKMTVPVREHRGEILRQAAQNYMDGTFREERGEKGKVILTGAGCGAYDLITVRGLNAVRNAQVLVYDDLIDERLLSHAGESCEKIYVGKRSGKHSMPQDEINAFLIAKAKEGKMVVRLKGGDPFVFGRGGEEMLALKQAGIEVEEIPGISSAVAVPAAAGIPVTHRGISQSFHVITGHGAWGSPAENPETLAALEGTLIFLMGLGNIEKLTEDLIACGKPESTPAAVIRGGFGNTVQAIRGCLGNIAERTKQSGLMPPAVIVIGESAGMDLCGNVPVLEEIKGKEPSY